MNRNPVILALLLSLLAGCAVQRSRSGGYELATDPASLLGEPVAHFKLADGSPGVLRRFQGQYSIKLDRFARVIYLPAAITSIRASHVEQIGERTTLLLETAERGCNYRYQLLSIQGMDVRTWQFGNCRDSVSVSRENDRQYFDLVEGRQVTRYVYENEQLRQGSFPLSQLPYSPPKPKSAGLVATGEASPSPAARYQPGLPIVLGDPPAATRPERSDNPGPARERQSVAATPKAPQAPAQLEFKPVAQEKVVVIDLKK